MSLEEAVNACPIPYPLMWAIAKAEYSRQPGYPYIIRVNSKRVSIPWLKKIEDGAYDCGNYETCVYVAKALIARGIENIDLGAFQINYKFHRVPPEEAFKLPESYLQACKILVEKVKRFGWSWEGVAAYHSATPDKNKKYAEKLRKILIQQN